MKEKSLRVLEYHKIIEQLSEYAATSGGRDKANSLKPYSAIQDISLELARTSEGVSIISRKGPLPIGGFYDIRNSLSFASKGGTLSMKQLLEVHYNLVVARQIISFMKSEDLPELPLIRGMTDLLVDVPDLEEEIDRCILSEDEMADTASPALRNIRRSIRLKSEELRNKLSRIIASTENKTYLQDSIVTMRDGRYVIPVKQEYRQKFPGMIHDQSKGGQTLFIEPQAIVEMNNKLRELAVEEQAEITRILEELSAMVGEHYHDIKNNQGLVEELDFIMAKSKLSRRMDGEEPKMNEGKHLKLIQARHPLIDPDKVVPINIEIGNGYSTLIITGPNTGGKTVSLKTVGLLSLMAMSGLHIPASSESALPIYEDVFADIGDEQSIEQSLSTFSSHMKNIVEIIDDAWADSLVLLDELGAGTDPTEGAALAISILDKLRRMGASVFATTHYTELKKYALSTEGVSNASMEFDVETLSPTYKLLIGIPGKSNAFEISKKLGLKPEIIEYAENLIEGGDMEFEDVISSIADDRRAAEEDRIEAARLAEEARALKESIDAKEKKIEAKRQEILDKAREEARDILREAKETTKELQKQIKELQKGGLSDDAQAKLEETRRRLRDVESKASTHVVKQVNSDPVSAKDLKVGDRVKHLTLDQNGEIISLPDEKGDVMVLIGALKLSANVNDLMLINEGKDRKQPAKKAQVKMSNKSMSVSASINVVGKNLEDALAEVEKYIDDVYLAGLEKATVIHGRGEGILKRGIRDMLKRNKLVKSFQAGAYNEGGEGVTVVTMKK